MNEDLDIPTTFMLLQGRQNQFRPIVAGVQKSPKVWAVDGDECPKFAVGSGRSSCELPLVLRILEYTKSEPICRMKKGGREQTNPVEIAPIAIGTKLEV
eukprot:CAMPEP_0197722842 /NCGR_PEP_ID=MMETSP1434-20131217/5386_1 /TAXON_ID=265543 /ORGANISM="Minutocellus polymorphus, Strain CCMP3303" /LENGTH=98 /DNA_ID=CAMNT_0043308035 /DNA_START=185 /DNA_END=481 /DNA_ORIENTATION=+